MPRILKRSMFNRLPRPLQGNVRVLGYGRGGPLVNSFQSAHDKANAENEKRYAQIKRGYNLLHKRVMGQLDGVGQQEAQDINRSYRGMGADVQNNLVQRGFGNGSLGATMQMGVQRERAAAQGRLNDRLAQQRANYDVGITTGLLGAVERRNDVGPDPNMLLALAQGQGRNNNGGYGTPIGPPLGMTGAQIGNAYQMGLQRHMMGMGMGFGMGVGMPMTHNAGNRAAVNQQTRQRRYLAYLAKHNRRHPVK